MDDFKPVTNLFVRKAIRNQFAINRFVAVFTHTRFTPFYGSCEEGVLTCMLYSDNGKQEGFVALLLTISTKKSTFNNGENRAI